jgi:hypothetical protein
MAESKFIQLSKIEWTEKEIIDQELVTEFITDELKKMQVDCPGKK